MQYYLFSININDFAYKYLGQEDEVHHIMTYADLSRILYFVSEQWCVHTRGKRQGGTYLKMFLSVQLI